MKNHTTQPISSYVFSDFSEKLSGCFGMVQNFSEHDITEQTNNNIKSKQIVVTLKFKIKSLKPSLIAKFLQAAMEVNTTWNYCNEISHKAIVDQHTWLHTLI